MVDSWRQDVKKEQWKNRIIKVTEEAPDQLLANTKNWRIHPHEQQQVLEGVLNEVGFVTGVIQNDRTGAIIDGHLRCEIAISKGQKTIPVIHVDLTEAEEAEILATFDPISAMAATDKEKLDSLLREVQSSDAAVMQMLAEMAERERLYMVNQAEPGANDPNEHWQGMPEFDQEEQKAFKTIKIHFLTEEDYKNFSQFVGRNLTNKTISIWYPEQYFDSCSKGKVYVAES